MRVRAGVLKKGFSLLDIKRQVLFLDRSKTPNARPFLGPWISGGRAHPKVPNYLLQSLLQIKL